MAAAVNKDLQRSIHQLLSSVITAMQGGSQSKFLSLEDAIANLETVDENFHSYDLVQYINEHIESSIGPLVDKGLKKLKQINNDDQNLVANIIEDALGSPEYNDLCQSTITDLKEAVEIMLLSDADINFNTSTSNMQYTSVSHSSTSSGTIYQSHEQSVGSEFSSLQDTAALMFIPQDQLLEIAHQLEFQPLQSRLEAIQQLLQFPPGDLPQCEHWSKVSQNVIACLMSEDKSLADLTLKLLSRMFSVISSSTTREVYYILSNGLMSYFIDSKLQMESLDPTTDANTMLLYRFRLLNHIQIQLPTYWIRYNEKVLDEIMNLTFTLIEMSYTTYMPNKVTPLHYLCLLDPNALWFQKWMCTHYGRTKVIQELVNKQKMLNGMLNHIIQYKLTSSTTKTTSQQIYTANDLSYLHFVHSINILEKLILYKHGQQLVTLSLKSLQNITSIELLIQYLMKLLLSLPHTSCVKSCDGPPMSGPIDVLTHLFGELAAVGNTLCIKMLCEEPVMNLVLSELDNRKVTSHLLKLFDTTISVLTTTSIGRHYLLQNMKDKQYSVIDVISQFVVKSLSDTSDKSWPSDLVYSCLFICCQYYSTSEGLIALSKYNLHIHIAKRIHIASKFNPDKDKKIKLIDNLLNFAGTPLGINLLEESGLMFDCILHMYHRYQQKLQVSQCEKFGYGYMVTQVSSNPAGIVHLNNSGYICDLVEDLWSLLNEMGVDSDVIETHPFDPANRVMFKTIINILKVLSSYLALSITLSMEATEATPRATPNTKVTKILELLKMLVVKYNSTDTISDEAHLYGLRIVSVLVTSLDSFLILNDLLNLNDILNTLQEACLLDNNQYLIDACSIERNRLLIYTNSIGGPLERTIPPHTLHKISDVYQWTFYTRANSSLPSSILLPVMYKHKPTQLFHKVVAISNIKDLISLYIELLSGSSHISTGDVSVLLQKSVELSTHQLPEIIIDSVGGTCSEENSKQNIALSLVQRYCQHIGLYISTDTLIKVLDKLYHQVANSNRTCPHNHHLSTDWFAITISLILFQSHDQSHDDQSCDKIWQFLTKYSTLLSSVYIWMSRAHLKPHLATISDVSNRVTHYIEFILQIELPLVYSAFRLSGYSPSQVCLDWLRQCFWNYLDWPEICHYILICTLLGIDYQIYYCVAVFKHLQSDILKACQEHSLIIFLKEEPLRGFTASLYHSFMLELYNKYHTNIIKDMNI